MEVCEYGVWVWRFVIGGVEVVEDLQPRGNLTFEVHSRVRGVERTF